MFKQLLKSIWSLRPVTHRHMDEQIAIAKCNVSRVCHEDYGRKIDELGKQLREEYEAELVEMREHCKREQWRIIEIFRGKNSHNSQCCQLKE